MAQDTFSQPGHVWSTPNDDPPIAPTAPAAPRPPLASEGNRLESRTKGGDRLHRLLWIFAILTIVLVAPSVVERIEYARTAAHERARLDIARENLKDFKLDQISAAYRMLAQSVGPSVVNVRTRRGPAEGQGSGVIVDEEGYIVTNNHVIDGLRNAEIQLSDGRRGPASVVGVDPLTDIAVLKTEMGDLTAAEWGDSNELEVGDLVWALGSPFGLQKSITSGILSAKERRGITGRVIQEFLQTDAAVNPGNSGGPLVDYQGKVVGINTAIIGPSYQGISFAIPSELAKASYEQLREHGYVLRGFLGIRPEEVPEQLARNLDLDQNEGVLVISVDPNTPAAAAGVEPGDVILTWNGEKFSDPVLLSRAIAATPIGSEIPVKLVRDSNRGVRTLDVDVTVAARPRD
jgi:serine protease Do